MNITKKERIVKLAHDTVGEFTLPDYLPAVGKLLLAECSVTTEDPYIKESSSGLVAELGGEAVFRVTWLGEGENEPATAVFRCDYDTSTPLGLPSGTQGGTSSPLCHTSTSVENVFCRVTGPRKLSLRARLASRIFVMSESEVAAPESLTNSKIETLSEDLEVISTLTGTSRDLYAAAQLPDAGEILNCYGNVSVTSCRPVSNDEIRAEGNLLLTCLLRRDGELSSESVTVPFDESISLSGELSDTDSLSLYCFEEIDSIDLHRDETAGTSAEITYTLSVVAISNNTASIVRDAYSCASSSTTEVEDFRYLSSPCSVSGTLTVNERCEGTTARGKVLYCGGTADIDSVTPDRGKLRFSGTLSGVAITSNDGEITPIPYSVPWKYEVPCGAITDDVEVEYLGRATPLSISARCDGSFTVTSEISLSAITMRELTTSRVKELIVSKESSQNTNSAYSIAVYYPEKSEKVWDIAKHFRVPVSRVASKYNLNDDGTPRNVVVI